MSYNAGKREEGPHLPKSQLVLEPDVNQGTDNEALYRTSQLQDVVLREARILLQYRREQI